MPPNPPPDSLSMAKVAKPTSNTDSDAPEIELSERPVGRATFAAIVNEVAGDSKPAPRRPFTTIGYEDAPLEHRNIYKIISTTEKCCDSADAAPEVTVRETRAGMATMAVIDEELRREVSTSPPRASAKSTNETVSKGSHKQASSWDPSAADPGFADCNVLELLTFIILDGALASDATEQQRRAFVAERLWHRLPAGGMDSVYRIDIRPVDVRALMMRVWCAVPKVRK